MSTPDDTNFGGEGDNSPLSDHDKLLKSQEETDHEGRSDEMVVSGANPPTTSAQVNCPEGASAIPTTKQSRDLEETPTVDPQADGIRPRRKSGPRGATVEDVPPQDDTTATDRDKGNHSCDSDQDEPNTANVVLNVKKTFVYCAVHKISKHKWILGGLLVFLSNVQLVLTVIHCGKDIYRFYDTADRTTEAPYPPWILLILLRGLVRFVLTLCLSLSLWNQFFNKRLKGDPLTYELERPRNFNLIKVYAEKHRGRVLKKVTQQNDFLQEMQSEIVDSLNITCLTSILQSVFLSTILMIMLIRTNGQDTITMVNMVIGVLDILSFFTNLVFSSITLEFYFTEARIMHIAREIRLLPEANKKLRQKAKTVDHQLIDRWYGLEILCNYYSLLLPLILFASFASQIPLGSMEPKHDLPKEAVYYWSIYIIAVFIGQLLISCPFQVRTVHLTGIILEVSAFIMLLLVCEDFTWSAYTHVLYAIIPLTYLIWYHLVSATRQWMSINQSSRADGNAVHVPNFASQIGFFVLIICTLAASFFTEFYYILSMSNSARHMS